NNRKSYSLSKIFASCDSLTVRMADYQPTWRRPIAQAFRRTAHAPVQWGVRGVFVWVVGFLFLRLWLNMLDGMVALASGTASRTGEIANELPDRISDVLIFVGVAHSGLCQPLGGYWVAIFALLVAYVGTLGQAVGVQREFSGVMAKPWRMVALHIGA